MASSLFDINDIAGLDRVGYLFGHPISHSLSPIFHRTIFDALDLKWSQKYLESLDMQQFLKLTREPLFFGASVTMPHKLAILPHLDELTPEARDVGACNTLFVRERNGKRIYLGTNTDVVGIKLAFYENVSSPDDTFHNRPGLVVGGGGAARSAVYALRKFMQTTDIYIVNRDKSEVDAVIQWCTERGYGENLVHVDTVERAHTLKGPGAIVSCVPDFPPKTREEKTARKVIELMLEKEHKGAILEMCYHPKPWTEIAGIADKEGWQVILGTEAMIWQGLEQSRYWREEDVPVSVIDKVKGVIATELNGMRKYGLAPSSTKTPATVVTANISTHEEITPVVESSVNIAKA
ncbi:quinate dehydrogenase [Pseudovirgaria hyperparasitica]|uniref:Quinate dehydrogenase n=1 Tax=Pseudovirgaria hyperparasitica TaxID=470096 RepID=A0A6A6WG46_9PEZI|nr:quinate dehydrogenase [Pseudovirgaria hyperparasitica]KAF2761034.1 quinate dehydrogenase [Pseudovirgaria hyperparasitica]